MNSPNDAAKAPAKAGRMGMVLGGLAAVVFLIGGIVYAEYRMGMLDLPGQQQKGMLPHLDKDKVGNPAESKGRGRRAQAAESKSKAEEPVKE